MKRLLHALALTVAFPLLVGVVVYYGFGTNYTDGVFHEHGFRARYESGVYKYRILGQYFLLKTHQFVKSQLASTGLMRRVFTRTPASTRALDKETDATFYAAYFLQNILFLILASVLLYFVLAGGTSTPGVSWPVMVAGLLMGLTQYVVCPYDTLSYALLLLSFLLIVRPFRFSFPLLVLTTVAGTLTKETAALTLSFFSAYNYRDLLVPRSRELRRLAILALVFATIYAGLRLHFGLSNRAVWHNVTLPLNLVDPFNWVGLAAMPVVSYLLCARSRHVKRCLLFLAASSPYIVIMPIIATGWEMRLWVPVWLGLICLARDLPGDSFPPTSGRATCVKPRVEPR